MSQHSHTHHNIATWQQHPGNRMQTTDSGTRNINNRRIATAQLLRNAATEDDNDTSTSRRLRTSTSILQLDHLTLYNNDLDKYLDDSTATTSTATTTTTTSTTRQLCNNSLDNSTTTNNKQLPRQLYSTDLDNSTTTTPTTRRQQPRQLCERTSTTNGQRTTEN